MSKKDSFDRYEQATAMLCHHIEITSGDIPSPVLRFILRSQKVDPKSDVPVPLARALFDYAWQCYARSKGYELMVLKTTDFTRQSIDMILKIGTHSRQTETINGYTHSWDRTVPVPICYISEDEHRIKYDIFLIYVEAVLASRRCFRRSIRNVLLFDFDNYPDHTTVASNQLSNRFFNPFVWRGGGFHFK